MATNDIVVLKKILTDDVIFHIDEVQANMNFIELNGWAISNCNINNINVYINNNYVGDAIYGTLRNDVKTYYPNKKNNTNVGLKFSRIFNTVMFLSGNNILKIFIHTDNNQILEALILVKVNDRVIDQKINPEFHYNYLFDNANQKNVDKIDIIEFPQYQNPLVSVIIPVFNQWEFTQSCLRSILTHTKEIDYEIILIDDASTDETKYAAKYTKNINIIRNEGNLGFLKNCNKASIRAKGKYLMLLNNDTIVQDGWLKYLIAVMNEDEKCAIVGSKLIYPDGTLQEAGGIVWKDLSAWNYGNGDDPNKSEYNYLKEVDYISGASILIRKSFWDMVGGFDEQFSPAYCEDTDLAFQARKHGYKVIYQPLSTIIHFEGTSCGTDISSGIKKYQEINLKKFFDKWKNVLESEHFNNGENVYHARDRSRKKKTILFIDHYVPHIDKDAGSKSTYQLLMLFKKLGYNIKFIGDNYYKHEPYTTNLCQLGIEVLYGDWYFLNWKEWLLVNKDYIDIVFMNRPHISIKYIDFLKENLKAKLIYYGHDLHYLRVLRQYEIEKNKALIESSNQWKEKEKKIFSKVDLVYYPSNLEVETVQKEFPSVNVKLIPLYIYDSMPNFVRKPLKERNNIVFVGGFVHKPNLDAVNWFTNEIYPLVLKKYPDMIFYIIGSNAPESILSLDNGNIKVLGHVREQELINYYKNCRLMVVPLRYGAGLKGKIVESLYYQIPVVTTSVGAEGFNNAQNYMSINDNTIGFADEIVNIYDNFELLEEKMDSGLKYVSNNFISDNIADKFIKDMGL